MEPASTSQGIYETSANGRGPLSARMIEVKPISECVTIALQQEEGADAATIEGLRFLSDDPGCRAAIV